MVEELQQMHDRRCFKAIAVRELARREKQRAMEGLMLVTQKRDGRVKARLAYNCKPTREWVSREDKSSPTALTESIMLLAAIDAKESRDVMVMDIPNAFIQTHMPDKDDGERVMMKIRGRLVDWLLEIDTHAYNSFVVMEKGEKVLYLHVIKAIYGMLEASLMWYRKLRRDLEEKGFQFNGYDPCVANRIVNKVQHTIRFHVDDIMSSHKDAAINDEFAQWANKKYGSIKKVSAHRGKIHEFLGMKIDFKVEPGKCHIIQKDYVEEIVSAWPEEIKGKDTVLTPAANDLYKRGEGGLLNKERKEIFNTIVAKCLFVAKRSRLDILPTVSLLSGRVREPNKDDWGKARRLIQYLNRTVDLHLVLHFDNLSIARWHVDASFGVHEDFKSQSGGLLTLSLAGGAIISSSSKQKLNTRSSTEAELVAVDDFIGKLLWTQRFLREQGYNLQKNILYQDNKSAILLETKGRSSLGKRSRALLLRYFFITDCVARGEVKIEYCPTENMVGDFFTKPLQGAQFRKFRRLILGM